MAENSLTIRIPLRVKELVDRAVKQLARVAKKEGTSPPSRSSFMIEAADELVEKILTSEDPDFETRLPGNLELVGPKEMVSISVTDALKERLKEGARKHADTTTQIVLRAASLRAVEVLRAAKARKKNSH